MNAFRFMPFGPNTTSRLSPMTGGGMMMGRSMTVSMKVAKGSLNRLSA